MNESRVEVKSCRPHAVFLSAHQGEKVRAPRAPSLVGPWKMALAPAGCVHLESYEQTLRCSPACRKFRVGSKAAHRNQVSIRIRLTVSLWPVFPLGDVSREAFSTQEATLHTQRREEENSQAL
jgi:hypothetical protein